MFDDPIRKIHSSDKKQDDFTLDFSKAKKGLGDEYADDYQKKLMGMNPDAFLDDLTGEDSNLKKEIDDIFNRLMTNLNQLSNVHFVSKRLKKESTIRTENVPALALEEAIPINVSKENTKSAREVFSITQRQMHDKDEMTKEEKRKDRANKKRKIKTHLHKKEIKLKEKNRERGLG